MLVNALLFFLLCNCSHLLVSALWGQQRPPQLTFANVPLDRPTWCDRRCVGRIDRVGCASHAVAKEGKGSQPLRSVT